MDRLFVIDKNYYNDIRNPDGCLIRNALKEFCGMYCDKYTEVAITENNTYKNACKQLKQTAEQYRIIPIGSLEFVEGMMKTQDADINVIPIEIPGCLRKYLDRPYNVVYGKDIDDTDLNPDITFTKDVDTLKKFHSLFCMTSKQVKAHIQPDTRYSMTPKVRFLSEWRIFVCEDTVLGAECYQGNPITFPDAGTIKSMIDSYSLQKHPKAYTLDVGVRLAEYKNHIPIGIRKVWTKQITEPIEIHAFFSCGLYGFYDRKLLNMWDYGIQWIQNDKAELNMGS